MKLETDSLTWEQKMKSKFPSECTDADLVRHSRQGDKDAFGILVSRHQSAVSAVAYAICGDFSQSEDLAQDSFVTAWKQIFEILNPAQFRSWVCGIARKQSLNHVRRRSRRKDRPEASMTTEDSTELTGVEVSSPHDLTVSDEEKRLIWSTLELLPLNYREIISLYYREHHSAAAVASALGLSEDAVKQRLSRGRTLMREKLSLVLEHGLAQSKPDIRFTASVLAVLPPLSGIGGVSAASGISGIGSVAGKGIHVFGNAFVPFASMVSGVVGILGFYTLYEYLRSAQFSPQFRRALVRMALFHGAIALTFAVLFGAAVYASLTQGSYHIDIPASGFLVLIGLWLFIGLSYTFRCILKLKRLAEGDPDFRWESPELINSRWESRMRFLGLPLVSICSGQQIAEDGFRFGKACGWIAIGDFAIGGLFAVGGIAIAPISLGGIAVGIVSMGGIVLGIGVLGGFAIGLLSIAGVALGWSLSIGGIAVAHDFACGGIAIAAHVAVGAIAQAAIIGEAAYTQLLQNPIAGRVLSLVPYAGWLSVISIPSIIFALRKLKRKSGVDPDETGV